MYTNYAQPQPPVYPGVVPNAMPKVAATQPITPEMSKMLHQNSDVLSVKISAIDNIKAQCTHKNPSTGVISLITLNNGDRVRCSVCGEEWDILSPDTSPEDIKVICDKMVAVLQTEKAYHVNAPVEFTKEFYQIINLLKRVPEVWRTATSDFLTHENYHSNPTHNININGNSAFNAVGNLLNTPFNMYQTPYQGQPIYGQYGQQPYMQPQAPQYAPQQQYAQPPQAPQYAPQQYAQPQAPVYPGQQVAPQQWAPQQDPGMAPSFTNPMAFNEPAPQAPIAAPMATPSMAAPAPTGPAVGSEVVQTKSFSV